jgi:hypothetical protein
MPLYHAMRLMIWVRKLKNTNHERNFFIDALITIKVGKKRKKINSTKELEDGKINNIDVITNQGTII